MGDMHTSGKFILWGGLAFACGVAWTLGAAIPPVFTLAVMLGIVIVIILILAYAILIISERPAQPARIRYAEWPAPQEVEQPIQPRPEPKRLQAQATRYSVVETPQAKLPQARNTIGTKSQKRIEVRR